ncbi:MaoC family dehydratase [Nocardioides gilvus]|uniref:MaoC family dehydratase n=1 Tax=Nocardioides gilvus TaxID=1735589 RepID=UPI000D750D7A|nr:MaoC family dehydratase [Nocardioides gilvus]
MRVLTSIEEIEAAVGETLGTTDWVELDQAAVDTFADLTGDHQWIHVDAERAAESSFGGTIVHGFLTLSMLPGFATQLFRIDAGGARLNYGVEKVRFPAPLRTGSRVRGSATFTSVTKVPSGTQVRTSWTVEAEGSERPVCVAETITLVLP